MKSKMERKKSKGSEGRGTRAAVVKPPLKLLPWHGESAVIREPEREPPRFGERASDVAHWGINE